jgi:hypothetical protein
MTNSSSPDFIMESLRERFMILGSLTLSPSDAAVQVLKEARRAMKAFKIETLEEQEGRGI